jgi:DNA modification methylase
LAKIIRHQGWRSPIVVSKRSGFVVAGHGRLQAAQLLQVEKVPVDYQDFANEAEEYAHLVADNRIAELAEIDEKELAGLLKELDGKIDLDLTGFDADGLSDLGGLLGASEVDAEPQIDKAAELQKEWKTARGQIWELGEHRLMCGDCRETKDVTELMRADEINLAFTSPPYAAQREYDPSSGFSEIPPDEYVEWFYPVQSGIRSRLAVDGSFFLNIKPNADGLSRMLYVMDLVVAHVRKWEWIFAEEFCWERAGIPQQVVRRFKNQFEPVYQFVKSDWKIRPHQVQYKCKNVPVPMGRGAGDTNASKRQGVKSAVDGNKVVDGLAYPGNRLPPFAATEVLGHSAVFPVGLPSFFIEAYTDSGDLVYEPFSGSGTTIIACERLGRRCRAMEISPGYVAVALQRYKDATGKTPKLLNA